MAKDDTSEYSSSKAPETRREAEEPDTFSDTRLIPGGAQPRTDTPQGMAGLDREQTPRADSRNVTGKIPKD
jgi:hypothetical protein